MNSFSGFAQTDFAAFADKKIKNKKFNKERKVVWQKIKSLHLLVDSELKKTGFPLKGKESRYDINYVKRKVNGIWVAYTHIKPYYRVCQLNYGIYKDGFFIGIELRGDAKEQVKNMIEFIKLNPDEFLEFGKKLNPHRVYIDYDDYSVDPHNATKSDLTHLIKTVVAKEAWFEFGEWHPKTKRILKSSDIVPEIIRVFETLYPLYLVFSGLRPTGDSKIDKLQRITEVPENDLEKTESEIARDVQQLSKEDREKLIAKNDARNRAKGVQSYTNESKAFRRDATLSAALKEKYNDQCQICKTTYKIKQGFFCDTHHIEPLKEGGKDTSENVLVVCPNHHRLLDRLFIEVISRTKNKIKIKENGKIREIDLE